METTRRFAALAVALTLLLGACTSSGEGSDSTGPTGTAGITGVQDTGPTPAPTLTPGVGTFTYENGGLTVTADVEGSSGLLEVANRSGNDLGAPDLYVLDAVDGHEIPVDVVGSAPVPAGETSTFDISLGEIDVDQVGLLVLLFGKDNYGAFVRTG
jgi:hypothetical protein